MTQIALVIIAVLVTFYVAQNLLGNVQEAPPSDEAIDFLNITTALDEYTNWQVLIYISNQRDTTVILERVVVNGMEASEYSAGSPSEIVSTITTDLVEETDLESGGVRGISVWIGRQFGFFISGSIIDIKFESAAGNEFVKTVILP